MHRNTDSTSCFAIVQALKEYLKQLEIVPEILEESVSRKRLQLNTRINATLCWAPWNATDSQSSFKKT